MRSPYRPSRREFVRLTGLAAGAAGLALAYDRAGREASRPRPAIPTLCSPICSRATSGSSAGSSSTRADARRLRGPRRGAGAPGHHRRLRRLASGTRIGLRPGGRRPVRGPRGGQHRQRRGPDGEREHRVRGRASWGPGSSWCWATPSAARSRPPSSTSMPTTPCPGRSASSSTRSGRPSPRCKGHPGDKLENVTKANVQHGRRAAQGPRSHPVEVRQDG